MTGETITRASETAVSRKWIWLILGLALLLRSGLAVAVDRYVQSQGRSFLIEGDANGYWELATKIAAGQEYSIYQPPRYVLRMPAFPFLLSGCILIFGDSPFAASLVLAAVGTASCWLTWLLARRTVGEREALCAVLLAAISPLQVGNSILILSESLFGFSLLICLMSLISIPGSWGGDTSCPRFGVVRSFISGMTTGLAVLVRPGWILWAGLSGVLVLLFGRGSCRSRLLSALLIVLGCYAVLTPWGYRNYRVTGHWVFTSLWSGPSLYDGLHERATGASDMRFFDEENLSRQMSEFDVNENYKRRAAEFVWNHPWRTLKLAVVKAGRYLSPYPNAPGFASASVFLCCLFYYLVFFGLILCGIWQLKHRLSLLAVLAGPFLLFLLVHMVFVGSVRYRLPVEFPLSIIAGVGFTSVWNWWWYSDTKAPSNDGAFRDQA
jgi:4-amino-4-deoxy-L-arabinose transferase-like glycosyltransferase